MSNRPNMLINLPPPPSDPYTPNEAGPGTPNSTTTSISALSVVAIKDGAVGHTSGAGGHRQSNASASTLEAERADRISRLAGLERVATVRSASGHLVSSAAANANVAGGMAPHGGMIKEISTVGSASATGSVGEGPKTTWAEQSEMDYDVDKMSEDQDIGDGTSSVGAASDEMDKASLVAFGEGAGSMIGGPVNTASARLIAGRSAMGGGFRNQSYLSNTGAVAGTPAGERSGGSTPVSMTGMERPMSHSSVSGKDSKMMDGVTYDRDIPDTTGPSHPAFEPGYGADRYGRQGTALAERVMADRMNDENMRGMQTPPDNQNLGQFGFEKD